MENRIIKMGLESGEVICERVKMANTMDERMIGLMMKKDLVGYDGLLIVPCNSIHTFFMRMNIDVLFLDKKNKIVKIIYDMKPWRLTGIYFKAHQVLEMKAGTLSRNIKIGDTLREYV